jgi:isoquinoline 1-oxidoreductase subunit beta
MTTNPFHMTAGAIRVITGGAAQSRRGFLAAAGAGLTLAVALPASAKPVKKAVAGSAGLQNAFITVGTDNKITVLCKHLDMGQGIYSGFATVVADELDADWSQMQVKGAPAELPKYGNAAWGGTVQGTGGSTGMSSSYDALRKAGAAAREMLVQAASRTWSVPASEITVSKGMIAHSATARTASFGQLAAAAAKMPVPAQPKLKTPDQFIYIGKEGPVRLDQKAKSTGREVYPIDQKLPGMKTAVIARAPKFGGTVKRFDAGKARAVPGVVDVVQVPTGVAVIANNSWAAMKGREALGVEWDFSAAETRSTDQLITHFKSKAQDAGVQAIAQGDAAKAMASAARTVEAEFYFPYLAHAAMEPLSCTGRMTAGGCELWAGFQIHTLEQAMAAQTLGLQPAQVKLHSLQSGGGFGRRATANADYVVETASLLKVTGGKYPIKLMWSREDDITGGRYRPMTLHKVKVGLDQAGKITAWQQTIVSQSITAGTPFAPKEGVDFTVYEGVAPMQYDIPNARVGWVDPQVAVPVLWWRSVGHTHTAYSKELLVERIAKMQGQDPLAYRLAMLEKHPRHAAVLKLAAEKAGWGKALAATPDAKRGRGIAVHESFGSYVAQIADVSVSKDGVITVDRIVCAVDCGLAVSPDAVRAQMEGGIGFGYGAALADAITLKDGVVEQNNYDTYESLRIDRHPKQIDVHILNSGNAPSGVGEPGTPPSAAAIANAIFAATGKNMDSLPFNTHDLKWA